MPLFKEIEVAEDTLVHVWKIEEEESFFLDKLDLSPAEKEYYDTLKGRRVIEYLASRYVLHVMSEREERGVCLKDDFGKPYLEDSDFKISFSHSHDYVAVIAGPKDVGVDIQIIVEKIERIADKFLNSHEADGIFSDRLNQLHYFWGAKESLYKAYGRKKVNFKTELLVEPPVLEDGIYRSEGYVLKSNYQKIFDVESQIFDNYILVTAVETTEKPYE